MSEPNNIEGDRDQKPAADEIERSSETAESTPRSYYYDDSTGYEIYQEDETDDDPYSEEPATGSASVPHPHV